MNKILKNTKSRKLSLMIKNRLNFYVEFKDWYLKIVKEFNFNPKKDRDARDYLSRILLKKSKNWSLELILNSFNEVIKSRSIILIYGCGPSLEESVEFLLTNEPELLFDKTINLAADGASVLLKQKKIPIHGIFTDLDGIGKTEFNYADFIIVHAHGDNMDKLNRFKNDIIKSHNVIGTTQAEPIHNVINPGGFTDGDRILFFLRTLLYPYHKVFLIGMDFNNIIGKYSKPDMNENKEGNPVKIKKLQFAVRLLIWILERVGNQVYFVNSDVISEKFNYLSLEEFKKQMIELE